MKTIKILLVLIILGLGIFLRLHKIDNPIAEWHSFRQADTASVTKNFINNNFIDILHPTYHDLSNVQSGKDNPKGYRMVELPIYNALCAATHNFFKSIPIDIFSRYISIFITIITAIFIFLISKQITHQYLPSLFSLIIFLTLPYNIFYSRSILPEPTAVLLMTISLYFFPRNLLVSAIALSLAVLIKPYVAIILFPTCLFYIYKFYLNKKIHFLNLLLFLVISFLPFFLWRQWIKQFPTGIPSSNWLFNDSTNPVVQQWVHGYNLTWLNKMVAFRPHWFEWLFLNRISNLILGSYGLIPLFLGLAYRKKSSQPILFSFIFGIILYFAIVAQGNIQHDYYQYLISPQIAIITGIGFYYLYNFIFKNKILSIFSLAIIYTFTLFFSWQQIKNYYKINNPIIIDAGKKVDEITPKNALIIAPYTGDTAFLYQTNRSGWPIEIYPETLPQLKIEHSQNPIYLVSVNFDKYTNDITPKYKTLYKNDKFIILDLN